MGTPSWRPPPRPLDDTDRLFRAAYALCGSDADAEELVHETFTRALRRPGRVRRRDERVQLMRVLRRAWHDLQQPQVAGPARGGPRHATEWVVDAGADPDLRAGHVRLAYEAIPDLPPPLREAIAAVDVLGLSHRDAARALRIRRRTLTDGSTTPAKGSQPRSSDEPATRKHADTECWSSTKAALSREPTARKRAVGMDEPEECGPACRRTPACICGAVVHFRPAKVPALVGQQVRRSPLASAGWRPRERDTPQALRTRSATTWSTPCPRSVAIRSRRLASSPSTLTTIVTLPPESASTTCTSRGSIASSSSSKSPGWGSGSVQGSFAISTTEDLTLASSCVPAGDDQPRRRLVGPLDDERQSSAAVGTADDEATGGPLPPSPTASRVPQDQIAVVEKLLGLLDQDGAGAKLLRGGRRSQQLVDHIPLVGYLYRQRPTSRG